jgi:hypothetical protein
MGLSAAALVVLALAAEPAAPAAERFREANEAARSGDFPRALAGYAQLAASGAESASLYWNWAQAAAARGARGEALWGLLRARELDPADRAVSRELERLRQAANLDAAEIAPEPLAALGRWCRRLRLALAALVLAGLSALLHSGARLPGGSRRLAAAGLWSLGVAVLLGGLPLVASLARPTGVVVRRGAALLEAASPTAGSLGALREGEVVPILEQSAGFLHVEDSAGARGWARIEDVRPLERPHE